MNNIEEVVRQVQIGNLEKYSILIEAFQKQLFNYIYHLIGDKEEAEDITQEVFIKAYNSIGSYHNLNAFGAWLYKIAYNHTINVIRRKRIIRIIPGLELLDREESSTLDEDLHRDELSLRMEKALSKLSMEERSLLFLRVLEERSYEEISVILNIKPDNLRKKFERAKKKVRKHYEINARRVEYEQFSN